MLNFLLKNILFYFEYLLMRLLLIYYQRNFFILIANHSYFIYFL